MKILKPLNRLLLTLLLVGGCSSGDTAKPGKTVMSTQSGETGISVTEATEGGSQVIRVTTTFRGEASTVVLSVDEPNYEIDIPLSIQQVRPKAPSERTGKDDFQDLMIAQYLEKAQNAMLQGNYNEALRQVNLVLMVRPDHIKSHEMKGSIYYAMGSYQLANEEWEQVLALDPSNEEVRGFLDFMKNRQGANQPPVPGAQAGGGAPPPAPVSGQQAPQPPANQPPAQGETR